MRVTYAADGAPFSFETQEEDDLREMAIEIERHLRSRHPVFANDQNLPILIADSLLNSLADEQDEIALGSIGVRGTF